MFHLVYTNRFKKDTKGLLKRGFEMSVLKNSILELEKNGMLDISKRPHKLSGKYKGYWEASFTETILNSFSLFIESSLMFAFPWISDSKGIPRYRFN